MKILHTSDWHLGHTLYNYDRSPEQQAFLNQLTRIVAEEKPDAMVVSGDIYHYSTPSATTQRMYTDGMLEIHRACPEMIIVVTAGNHDSSSKLEIDSNLWNHFGVKVVGNIERTQEEVNLEKHIIEVRDKEEILKGYIIAVPHVYPQNFPMLDTETPREERQARFFQALLDEVEKINTDSLPVVLSAHLSIEGSDRTGHDETVGGIEYIPISSMGEGYDYLALGHIHCPQNIKGNGRHARYCGTPLPVNFDETYPHSVSIVEIRKHEEPEIRTIEIENPMPFVTLPKEAVAFDEAMKLLEEYPDDKPAYIRLNVLIKDYLAPDCNERASGAVKGKRCKYCYIKSNREKLASEDKVRHISIQEMQEMSPLEIAKLYYQEAEGEEMDEELCELMNAAVQSVQGTNERKK
ncbi:exonuclease SbcCD subunit D [Bacteroides sp. UBA939]|uniref:exonuclease SbcCD subunit D n=1 Tax=Bacteroides sp. UBA939 TaxID=1946092 RepID=UPI0025C703D7|nr:exonuclease SbcCD subunit D [Bacteroides sp. UBA939]